MWEHRSEEEIILLKAQNAALCVQSVVPRVRTRELG